MISMISVIFNPVQNMAHAQSDPSSWNPPAELVTSLMNRQDEFNYVESSVVDYQLPDSLKRTDGESVTTITQWYDQRRPELLNLFRNHVYGRRPQVTAKIRFDVTDSRSGIFDGKADGRTVRTTIEIDGRTFAFEFEVIVPLQREAAVPAMILINNRYRIPLKKLAGEPDEFWPVETIIERGFATASFFTSDVDPDRADGYSDGVRAFFADGQPPAESDWRSLSSWGWAASRIADYLETLPEINADQLAVVGHSRGGKTALWAAAEDTRFAIAYSNQSGCGGASLSRRNFGETIGRITTVFPHWFVPDLATYAGREPELPIDQHQLIALVAPRAVYIASADEDLWADPRGEYLALVAASPVFQLLQVDSISDPVMPALNSPRREGVTGYHVRPGKHGLNAQDWERFMNFAAAQFSVTKEPSKFQPTFDLSLDVPTADRERP